MIMKLNLCIYVYLQLIFVLAITYIKELKDYSYKKNQVEILDLLRSF